MLRKRKLILILVALAGLILLAIGLVRCSVQFLEYSFARPVSPGEQAQRLSLVHQAQSWLGTVGGTEAHAQLLEIYNTHEPLAQGYLVQPEDKWCAAFVSAMAIQTGLTDIIPTECGCQRQISLWQELGCWEENDSYEPLPGDVIYYSAEGSGVGDNTGWADHVGIVVGTRRGWIKVIEGNCNNKVAYRYIPLDDATIRGYAIPNYCKS